MVPFRDVNVLHSADFADPRLWLKHPDPRCSAELRRPLLRLLLRERSLLAPAEKHCSWRCHVGCRGRNHCAGPVQGDDAVRGVRVDCWLREMAGQLLLLHLLTELIYSLLQLLLLVMLLLLLLLLLVLLLLFQLLLLLLPNLHLLLPRVVRVAVCAILFLLHLVPGRTVGCRRR